MSDVTPRFEHHAQYWSACLLGALPRDWQLALSGRPPLTVDDQTLDAQIQLMIAMRDRLNRPPVGSGEPEEARARMRRDCLAMAGPTLPVGRVEDLTLPGAEGPIRARHYAPDLPGGPHPLLVFFHGGGFVLGDLDTHDAPCRLLCRHGGMHVLSIDYRRAPEHPFPAGLNDAVAALRWAQAHAGELGADPERVAVGGDSAGGNLAAVVSQLAARDGGAAPVMQLLIYPSTDRVTQRPSRSLFGEGFFLSPSEHDWYDRHYLEGTGTAPDDPLVSPLLATDLTGLPPALVVTAGMDLLRDEGEAYAQALEAAGNRVRHVRVNGLVHGFINMIGFNAASREALVAIARDTKAMLSARPAAV
jgi:acetyl esterase